MWLLYSKRTGKIVLKQSRLPKGSILDKFSETSIGDRFEWDVSFFKILPQNKSISELRVINGGIISVDPEHVKIYVEGADEYSKEYKVAPGSTVALICRFYNGFGKIEKATGTVSWDHDRGYLRPKRAKVIKKEESRASIIIPNENIVVNVTCVIQNHKADGVRLIVE